MQKSVGFTLIELLVVVLIIGILAAVAVPQYEVAVAKSRYTEVVSFVNLMFKEKQRYRMATGESIKSKDDMDVEFPANCMSNSANNWISCPNADYSFGWDSFVLGENKKNSYIIYEDGRRICRAVAGDKVANTVCKSMGATLTVEGQGNCSLASKCNVYDLK